MDQIHVIRHKVLVEGRSARRVAREMGLSRNTVKRYLGMPAPVRSEREARARPVAERVMPRLEEILGDTPRWTGGKQHLTAARLHQMLLAEGFVVGITFVRSAVAEWKRRRREVYVPLVYHPGELAEVDFFEVLVEIAGTRRKGWMFVMRLMHSGRDFAHVYDRQDQVSFLDGHVRAFAHFGAVPQRLAYDNLRAAVRKILVGAERALTARFEALASHYLFEASFCRPATGHDKGGVEGRGKGIRLQELVPIPRGESLADINTALLARLDARLGQPRAGGAQSVGELFAAERGHMLPLPERPFCAAATCFPTATSRSLVKIEGAFYSVPCAWARLELTARVGAEAVEVVGVDGTVVLHPRKRFGERSIDYRHYLPELARKPQAVRQVAAELTRDLGEPFASAWRELVDAHGPRDAARIFAKVLGHVVERGHQEVGAVVAQALRQGEPLLLALAAAGPAGVEVAAEALPDRLRGLEVGAGRAADYDGWLAGGRS